MVATGRVVPFGGDDVLQLKEIGLYKTARLLISTRRNTAGEFWAIFYLLAELHSEEENKNKK